MSKTAVMRAGVSNIKEEKIGYSLIDGSLRIRQLSSSKNKTVSAIRDIVSKLPRKYGVYTSSYLGAAGFIYTDNEDTTRCNACGLEVSGWTINMIPLNIHEERNPECSFIKLFKRSLTSRISITSTISSPSAPEISSLSNGPKNASQPKSSPAMDPRDLHNSLFEVERLKQIRRRTLFHWSRHCTAPNSEQMNEAGFFYCNVIDRVICIYCNLICQNWKNTDDPCEVHKTLSPRCIYVNAKLLYPRSILIRNTANTGETSNTGSFYTNNPNLVRSPDVVSIAACNPAYAELPKRQASFATWPNENLPSVDDLVRAGFFYTGTKTIVTCFYCNGSLQNWGATDNPMIEHARWFPHCAYAKQLCGDELYQKIQQAKRAQQERARANEARNGSGSSTSNTTTNSRQLVIPDESTLSKLVAARLDLPISQRLLDKNFKLSIIKRCWVDQLVLKRDAFASDSDLFIACLILQKQIEHIDGKKENIVIPSIKMNQMREQHDQQLRVQTTSNKTDIRMATSSLNESTAKDRQEGYKSAESTSTAPPSNPCVLCLTEEKRLACIPCGHLATCVPCCRSLRACPICRKEIDAFVRIYI